MMKSLNFRRASLTPLLTALMAATLLAALIVVYATTAPPAQASDAIGVEVVADTSTTPPPATLGGYSMTPFAPDSRPLFEDVSTVPAPAEGTLQFDLPMSHRTVPDNGWFANWGHGYSGDVYFSKGANQVVMTLPANTRAFYLHAQPNAYGTFTVTATADDGTTSGPIPVTVGFPNDQTSSAGFFGFYSKDGTALRTVIVEVPNTNGVAVGEFGIAYGPTTTDDCKHGGYAKYGFKNQGDCVSYVATHGKNEAGQNVPGPNPM